ncbi:hypothetical protein LTR53_001116 [Teratosphaeriaceae sp. CCFEE 6253]|nr:hypothetical protein LTR53_001116 [Teratosphaeriaceae sp. CCFEE 6253]
MPTVQLPPELWLLILPYTLTPYDPTTLLHLSLASPPLRALLAWHEGSLVRQIRASAACPARSADLFPDLPLKTFAGLDELYKRQAVLQELSERWPWIVAGGENGELGWLEGRWEGVFRAGALLLYRLRDAGAAAVVLAGPVTSCLGQSPEDTKERAREFEQGRPSRERTFATHDAQVRLLRSLPATSLACLNFVLVAGFKILRAHGLAPVNASRWTEDEDRDMEARVGAACKDVVLAQGVDGLLGLLGAGAGLYSEDWWVKGQMRAERALGLLRARIAISAERVPSTLMPSPQILSAVLRASLAEKAGCGVRETEKRMWAILSGTAVDGLGAGEEGQIKMGEVVRGEEMGRGMRRMGF